MKWIVERKLKEIKEEMKEYLDTLELRNRVFPDEYVLRKIRECRVQVWLLEEILEEYENE